LTTLEEYSPELVVIGGGMGGIACAMRARRLGARVAVIEPEALGGT
jgi:glutathione reductase (NADPH)